MIYQVYHNMPNISDVISYRYPENISPFSEITMNEVIIISIGYQRYFTIRYFYWIFIIYQRYPIDLLPVEINITIIAVSYPIQYHNVIWSLLIIFFGETRKGIVTIMIPSGSNIIMIMTFIIRSTYSYQHCFNTHQ